MHCVVDPFEMLKNILNLSKEDASDITKDVQLIRKILGEIIEHDLESQRRLRIR